MLRIFFNRTYATSAHIVPMLRNNPDNIAVEVIGTHSDPHSPVLAACDEAFAEPESSVTGHDYVDWALKFTRAHGIDVFVPRHGLADIAGAAHQFARAGVVLIAAPLAAIKLFEDKAATYADAAGRGLAVPPHHVVTDAAGLMNAYEALSTVADAVCLKPVTGVGGEGFRLLRREQLTLADLIGPATASESLDAVCGALDAAQQCGDQVPPLMVLPYLPGPEVSVDLLADAHGRSLAAVGRSKSARRRVIIDDRGARRAAELLVAAHGVSYLSNTQVRYWRGPSDSEPQPYLLEVNTRMSGGLFQTALSGLNLPWAAVRVALGQGANLGAPRYDISYSTVSSLSPVR